MTNTLIMRNKKGMSANGIMTAVVGVVGVIILDQLLNRTFSSQIMNTVKPYFIPIAGIAVLAVLAATRRK